MCAVHMQLSRHSALNNSLTTSNGPRSLIPRRILMALGPECWHDLGCDRSGLKSQQHDVLNGLCAWRQ
eukprot:2010948-Alexandrium_andersonii.AAC.1